MNPLFGCFFLGSNRFRLWSRIENRARRALNSTNYLLIIPVSVSICLATHFLLFLLGREHFRVFPAPCKVLFNSREEFSLSAFVT